MKNKNPINKAINLSEFIEDLNEIASIKGGLDTNKCPLVFDINGEIYNITEYYLSEKPQTHIVVQLDKYKNLTDLFKRPTLKSEGKYKVDLQEDKKNQLLYGIVKSKMEAEIIDDMVCDVLGTICPKSKIRFENGNYQYTFSYIDFNLNKLKEAIENNKGYVDWYTLYISSKNN